MGSARRDEVTRSEVPEQSEVYSKRSEVQARCVSAL